MTETIRVTFDSNVWEKVVFPDRCCSHEEKECFYTIQQMIRSGKIKAYLCETIFMLEAIQKKIDCHFLLVISQILKLWSRNYLMEKLHYR